ncbi:hypothetical protein BGZ54_000943, partial [Gamsiella multidivaricata]
MANVKSRFDASFAGNMQSTDGPWLSTYSRALCSIYPKDEEDCWDYLLSTQSSSIFSKHSENPITTTPSTRSKHVAGRVAAETTANEQISRSLSTTPSLSSSVPEISLLTESRTGSNFGNNSRDDDILLGPLSPGSISHALCKIGFDCIDYFTATQDDLTTSEPSKPTPSPNNNNNAMKSLAYTSPVFEDLTEADWRTDLAAAVCGKRTAALERKRALSRTMSQEDVGDATVAAASNDPWFQTLDRLARWDE